MPLFAPLKDVYKRPALHSKPLHSSRVSFSSCARVSGRCLDILSTARMAVAWQEGSGSSVPICDAIRTIALLPFIWCIGLCEVSSVSGCAKHFEACISQRPLHAEVGCIFLHCNSIRLQTGRTKEPLTSTYTKKERDRERSFRRFVGYSGQLHQWKTNPLPWECADPAIVPAIFSLSRSGCLGRGLVEVDRGLCCL